LCIPPPPEPPSSAEPSFTKHAPPPSDVIDENTLSEPFVPLRKKLPLPPVPPLPTVTVIDAPGTTSKGVSVDELPPEVSEA
jgi:hypothetical protein